MKIAPSHLHLDHEFGRVVDGRNEVDFVDVEAQPVQSVDALGDAEALFGCDPLGLSQLRPKLGVPLGDVVSEVEVGLLDIDTGFGRNVDIPPATFSIMIDIFEAASVRQPAVEDLGGFGVDHDRHDGFGVEAIQDVGEAAVAPKAVGEMKLDQKARKGIEHLVAAQTEPGPGQDLAI